MANASKPTLSQEPPHMAEVSLNRSTTLPKASVGVMHASSTLGSTSETTGELTALPKPLIATGSLHGATGAVTRSSGDAGTVATVLAAKLPSLVLSWLSAWSENGRQAVAPEWTSELLAETRAVLTEVYSLWKPVRGEEQTMALINQLMMTLSIYGYGALPSDKDQSKAKIAAFAEVLGECPLWAIQQACKAWRKERTEAPTPADLYSASRRAMGFYQPCFGRFTSAGSVYEKLVGVLNEGNAG